MKGWAPGFQPVLFCGVEKVVIDRDDGAREAEADAGEDVLDELSIGAVGATAKLLCSEPSR